MRRRFLHTFKSRLSNHLSRRTVRLAFIDLIRGILQLFKFVSFPVSPPNIGCRPLNLASVKPHMPPPPLSSLHCIPSSHLPHSSVITTTVKRWGCQSNSQLSLSLLCLSRLCLSLSLWISGWPVRTVLGSSACILFEWFAHHQISTCVSNSLLDRYWAGPTFYPDTTNQCSFLLCH